MRTSRRTILVITLLLSGAIAAWFFTGRGVVAGDGTDEGPTVASESEESGEGRRRGPTALPVAGAVVERSPFVVTVRATGRAQAHRRAQLALPVNGRIVRVGVREGDRVSAEQTLVEIDRRPYEITRNEATARLSNADSEFRLRLLSDSTATDARRLLVQHQSGLTEAQAALARAELDLEGTRLVAPFDGEVAELSAVEGAIARREEPILTLVDVDPIRIRAEILESDYGRIVPGAGVVVRFPAYPGETFEGFVESLGPEIDPDRGTGVAFVTLPNEKRRLKPGMFAEIEIVGQIHADRLSVPRDAVLERDRRLLVFRGTGGRAEWAYVETGLETRDRVEITSGLAPGDTVLVEGHLTLAHGAPVKVSLRK